MNNSTFLNSIRNLLFIALSFVASVSFAEGTKQVMPNSANGTALFVSGTGFGPTQNTVATRRDRKSVV